ncbi:MAG: YabP/YqfC family sporulation protein [Bacilli bacterium]|nr:YabP/YqfC family sporulation protein [Bacilli bacterium]MDD3305127.1 YabP/YqfC family sporulation protein [Bacilli bacterium]MDD4054129.1 YabP/YqfC family sporulation protein [Bacilli bacterium]MDD4411188.1 YabP/YqfC family sporulation protein [Bacilli bacterium]
MKIIDKLSDYIYDKDMSIHVYENHVNIVNYKEIASFDSTKIVIIYNNGSINIGGKNLVVSKLLSNELLISGEIKQIELR